MREELRKRKFEGHAVNIRLDLEGRILLKRLLLERKTDLSTLLSQHVERLIEQQRGRFQ